MGISISSRAWNKQFVKPNTPYCSPHGATRRSWRLPVAGAVVLGATLLATYGQIGSIVGSLTSRGHAALQNLLPQPPVVIQPTPELWREARQAARAEGRMVSTLDREEPRK